MALLQLPLWMMELWTSSVTVTSCVFNQERGHEAEVPAHLRTVVDKAQVNMEQGYP